MQEFCPECFVALETRATHCPGCGLDLAAARSETDFEFRLIHALRHPVAEVRMGAIEALRMRRAHTACDALLETALATPADVTQSLAVVECLAGMLPAPDARESLERLASVHRARSVRRKAASLLSSQV